MKNPLKRYSFLISICLLVLGVQTLTANARSFKLMIAPGTLSDKSVTILWDKQYADTSSVYKILLDGSVKGATNRTNFTLTGLQPQTKYRVTLQMQGNNGISNKTSQLNFRTSKESKIFNILDFGAKADSSFKNTKAIQSAIDACTEGGTVYIPRGTFVSGALFLKSNMTLFIEKGAVLKGSVEVKDYLPMTFNRFEGWEMETYASLLNAGKLDRREKYYVRNLRITGGGTIAGGGMKLGHAMIKAKGLRGRGRLICLMNCENVSISNLTISEPPCWTIHYVYSKNISCHDLNIQTVGIWNGDGIDPDSSVNSYIFNCNFFTGDDCIAIKSGKNPEGFYVAKPSLNIQITDCDFRQGHGISIGSEMSGGVSDVLVQNCKAGALLYGMQIKGTKDRGGYVKNVTVTDCELMKITVFSAVNYNNDGIPAPQVPIFENFTFKNIDLSKANIKDPVVDINGFKQSGHKLRNVNFVNVILPDKGKIVINDAENINFQGVKTISGNKPEYLIKNSTEITN